MISPCSSALVATVVPWARLVTRPRLAPALCRIAATPRTSPTAGFDGVLATLVTRIAPEPVSTATISVKVPPVSMPMRKREVPVCAIPVLPSALLLQFDIERAACVNRTKRLVPLLTGEARAVSSISSDHVNK